MGKFNIDFNLIILPKKADLTINEQLLAPFATNRSALVVRKSDGHMLGVLGEYKQSVKKVLKLPDFCAGFELNLDDLSASKKYIYKPLSKFPKVEQDISLKVPDAVNFAQLEQLIVGQMQKLTTNDMDFEITALDIYQPPNVDFKHFSFRFKLVSHKLTLKSKEVNNLLDKVAEQAKAELGAIRL